MFSLTIQDNHLNCRKQLRESSQLPEVLQKVRYRKNQTEKAYRNVQDPPLSGPSLLMRPSAGEFNLEVQHTSKVKIKQLFTVFLRHPESGKFLGITFIPPVNGLGGGALFCQTIRSRVFSGPVGINLLLNLQLGVNRFYIQLRNLNSHQL